MFENDTCPRCGGSIDSSYRAEATEAVESRASAFQTDERARGLLETGTTLGELFASKIPLADRAYERVTEAVDDRDIEQKMTNSPEEAAMWALHADGAVSYKFETSGADLELLCQNCD